MIEIIGAASLFIFGSIAYVVLGKKNTPPAEIPDIMEDYRAVKMALLGFKKDNINKIDAINQLQRYMEPGYPIKWKRYAISPDEKFLVVSNIGNIDCQPLIDEVGGASRKDGDKLYLSFLKFKVSEVEPKAVITMHPHQGITTTSAIEWSSVGSVVEGGEVRQEEWENKQELYSTPGKQKVSLRVLDRNENWSEWTDIEFDVVEVGGIKEIKGGSDFLLIAYNSGKVAGIGSNTFGQMGNGTQSDIETLSFISGYENVESISCGDTHVLSKDYQGKVSSVGSNDFGQLGLGNRLNLRSPQKLWGLERVKQLEAGKDFSAAVLMTGAVLTWGTNDCGQLGEDKPLYQELPRRVKNLSNVKNVALGDQHMACVHYDGSVTAWGDNSKGQVGSGFKGKMIEPTTLNIKGVKQVATGKDFTIALTEGGKLMGWGSNLYGQLGIVGVTEVLFPKEITKLNNVRKIAAKGQFVLALTDIGEVYTWGRYDSHVDEYYPEPVVADQLKYIKDIAATSKQAYLLTEHEDILTWGAQIDMRATPEEYRRIAKENKVK